MIICNAKLVSGRQLAGTRFSLWMERIDVANRYSMLVDQSTVESTQIDRTLSIVLTYR